MRQSTQTALEASTGTLTLHTWPNAQASWIAILVHGYGEHLGRYEHVADRLIAAGAVVFGADHAGHGNSSGEPVLIDDFEPVDADVRLVGDYAERRQAGLQGVVVGRAGGGTIVVGAA